MPLVELTTTGQQRFVSDNAGVIALSEPDLMNRENWFGVQGHGYEVPADGFGYRGVRLNPKPGQTLTVEVKRVSIAKRLGRLTGGGLFAELQKCGDEKDWIDSPIIGCDSVQLATLDNMRFWLWGDTTLARYPLGIFDSLAATTPLTPWKSFDPPLRPQFDYFQSPDGRPYGVAPVPGKGPTWIFGLVTLTDQNGGQQLVGTSMKIRNHLEVYEYGLCVWDRSQSKLIKRKTVWTKTAENDKPPQVPHGNAAHWTDPAGKAWILFGNPLPTLKCPATFEAWLDPEQWETIKPPEHLMSSDGKKVVPHSGSVGWHSGRKKWVAIFTEKFGKPSAFGEVWYAESSSPLGPWGTAVKVLSHNNYTFYNPRVHVVLTPDGSPILLFEGTYTAEFANKPNPTPRYNYNQILYRLDLDDPALAPALTP